MYKNNQNDLQNTGFDHLSDDLEATDGEMRGVAYTGMCLLIVLLAAIAGVVYIII